MGVGRLTPTTQRQLIINHIASMRDFAREVSEELGYDHKVTRRIRSCAYELDEATDRIQQFKEKVA